MARKPDLTEGEEHEMQLIMSDYTTEEVRQDVKIYIYIFQFNKWGDMMNRWLEVIRHFPGLQKRMKGNEGVR